MSRNRRQESDAWSSGEDEPEESAEHEDIDFIDYEDLQCDPGQEIFYSNDYYPSIKDFTGTASHLAENAHLNGHEPIDYFNLFLDNNLLDRIIQQTNLYQSRNREPPREHMKPWQDLVENEFRKFLGLTILMGHVRKVTMDDYWSTNPLLFSPIFHEVMPRNRYEQILRFLHFQDNDIILNHPLKKIKFIIDDLNEKFSTFLVPGRNLCIDESLVLWKGRLKFKQYLPLKRHRFGIKIFEIVDCESGYVLGFVVYTGADTECEKFDLGISGDIVAHFMKPYFGKGHVVFVDNWYSSPTLAEFLHNKDTGMCGTVRKNRRGLPDLHLNLEKGELQMAHNMVWMVIKWHDKKEVWMITTVHRLEYGLTGKKNFKTGEDIIKPNIVIDYNKNMGGIDNNDRQLALTESIRKCVKWYRKLFFHLIDLILINAHALYKLNEKKVTFTDFRMKVISSLVELPANLIFPIQTSVVRLTGRHFPCKFRKARCSLCHLSKLRKETVYGCSTCKVSLCVVPCFENYHTKERLP